MHPGEPQISSVQFVYTRTGALRLKYYWKLKLGLRCWRGSSPTPHASHHLHISLVPDGFGAAVKISTSQIPLAPRTESYALQKILSTGIMDSCKTSRSRLRTRLARRLATWLCLSYLLASVAAQVCRMWLKHSVCQHRLLKSRSDLSSQSPWLRRWYNDSQSSPDDSKREIPWQMRHPKSFAKIN